MLPPYRTFHFCSPMERGLNKMSLTQVTSVLLILNFDKELIEIFKVEEKSPFLKGRFVFDLK